MSQKKHVPYVPIDRKMTEFSYYAVGLGLLMSVILTVSDSSGQEVLHTFNLAIKENAQAR